MPNEKVDREAQLNVEHKRAMTKVKAEQDQKVRARKDKKGLLIVNTGAGKGKSTAAFGLVARAVGQKIPVAVVQFIKGTWRTGEQQLLASLPEVTWLVTGDGFTWNTQDRAQDIASAQQGWQQAVALLDARDEQGAPQYPLVVLDELNVVMAFAYLPASEIAATLAQRHPQQHVCVTGRDAPQELLAIADTVTEMQPVKHAFDAGIKAQRGIEF